MGERVDALLLEQPIQLDPRCLEVGNSWHQVNGGDYVGRNIAIAEWLKARLARVENPVFVDVGAHTGLFTLLAALLPNLRVYAFEPIFTDILASNVLLNDLAERVQIFKLALSNAPGNGTMHIAPNAIAGHSTMSEAVPGNWQTYGTPDVQAVTIETLDEMAENHTIAPTVIKIDVEGMEKFVVEGGEKTIQEHKPDLLIECIAEHTQRFGYGPYQTTRLLHSWGYTCKVRGNDAACIWGAKKSDIWD